MIKREINIFFNALLFYTRIKVPKSVVCNEQTLNKAFRYLPLVGIIVGSAGALTLWGVSFIMPQSVAIVAAMVVMMLATGAFHEDGLADFADGFGAGYDKETIMRIMKDSHIGTYGVLTLILSILFKFMLISSFTGIKETALIVIAAECISRFTPVLMLSVTSYVRSEKSKAAHSALGISKGTMAVAAIIAIAPLTLLTWEIGAAYAVVLAIFIPLFRAYTKRKIGGCTGDTLGALQQIAELLFFITALTINSL